LDTTFLTPLIYAGVAHINFGEWAELDSLGGVLDRFRDQLSAYDRYWHDYLKARSGSDHSEALRAIRGAAALAPGSKAVYNQGIEALGTNRPQEAVDAFLRLDADQGPMRGWVPYRTNLCWALHGINEHERELEVARTAYQLHPDAGSYWVLHPLVQGLAESGRVQELHEVFDEVAAVRNDPHLGFVLLHAVQVLKAHGHSQSAQGFLSGVIEWLEALPPGEGPAAPSRRWYGHALTLAGRYEDAQRVFDAGVLESPGISRFTYMDMDILTGYVFRGARALVAAFQGDTARAWRDAEWFEQLDPSSLHGEHTLQLARIVAVLGDRDRAVRLYRQSIDEGIWYTPWYLYWEPEAIRDHPEFQELMRPKG
jgi:tetratricopeptide (TPR) repeat protein